MNKPILPKFLITLVAILCVLCAGDLLFAKEEKANSATKGDPYKLQTQARQYREEGVKYQNMGNLSEAKGWYQKAITLDPKYAVVYNDLGIVYEAEGDINRAEENYLRAIKADPAYSSAYTNLAFLYENKRNLEKAEFYWRKRVELGFPDDPWTQKAASRLKDISLSLNGYPVAEQREEDVLSLMKDIASDKSTFDEDDQTLSGRYFKKAKQSFNKGELALAIKQALDAQRLDPKNKEIEAFIEKAQQRALTR